jgi:hypothetical protein
MLLIKNVNTYKSVLKTNVSLLISVILLSLIPWNAKAAVFGSRTSFSETSVLSTGNWYKYAVSKSGLHKISYNDLRNDGVLSGSIATNLVRVYGNGTGDLSFSNNNEQPNGLIQIPLFIEDGGDGVFNEGDAVYFFANAADYSVYNTAYSLYSKKEKIYDPNSYYFISIQGSEDEQALIQTGSQSTDACDDEVSEHMVILHHELNSKNLIKSGIVKYGESFDFTTSRTFSFDLANISNDFVRYKVSVAGASSGDRPKFDVSINGEKKHQITIPAQGAYDPYKRSDLVENGQVVGQNLTVGLDFIKPNSTASGYLDEIVINYMASNDVLANDVWLFDTELNPAQVYCVNVPNGLIVDVTDQNNPQLLQPENGKVKMMLSTNTRLLVADKNLAIKGSFVEQVENQNLHAINSIDYLIVAPKLFMIEAERLAALHRTEGLKVEVVEASKIYNEFSSGAVDIGGIRNFVRHLYAGPASSGNPLKYLLLFGDASYNNNFEDRDLYLPSYQSLNSESLTSSYVTDDFFGFLDSDGRSISTSQISIGIGRFPVSNLTEAKAVVDKVYRYIQSDNDASYGAWRNRVSFVSDDQNGANIEYWLHMNQANNLADNLEQTFNGTVVNKILLDAYKQVSTPGGERYPEANNAIRDAVQNGSLIVNYTGHGGELGWAHERILDVPTINSWTNKDRLSLFVTATCEFSRFDDPDRISAGEYALLNPNGGAIGLFTTTRLVYSFANEKINEIFYKYAIPSDAYPNLRVGDIMRLTKRDIASSSVASINHLNFSLLGDPAVRLHYPKYKVYTTAINGVDISQGIDTLRALGKTSIEGYIGDDNGSIKTDFNGEVEITINDKKSQLQTLKNEGSQAFPYQSWDKVIYKGSAEVVEGKFKMEFIVPRDLVFTYGKGRISYYAKGNNTDANGVFDEFTVGGQSDDAIADDEGPAIDLYMNSTQFKVGDNIGSDGLLLAYLRDSSGINTTGNGVGHDIIGYVDGNTQNAVILNDYFQSDLNSYQSGLVKFPLEDIADGEHTLTVRAWDINNNPSENSTRFVVSSGSGLQLSDLMNYPNPVQNATTFAFKSNAGDGILTATVKIYDSFGRLIDSVSKEFENGSFENEGLNWNINQSGQNISSGTFVYALEIKNEAGETSVLTNTMIVIR